MGEEQPFDPIDVPHPLAHQHPVNPASGKKGKLAAGLKLGYSLPPSFKQPASRHLPSWT
jgi:hypothetical protein